MVVILDIEQIALKLQETTDRSARNEGRIKKLEGEFSVLHQLATSVAVMAEQMKNMSASVDTLAGKVNELEDRPGKRWDKLVDVIIAAIGGVIVGYIFTQIGM